MWRFLTGFAGRGSESVDGSVQIPFEDEAFDLVIKTIIENAGED